MGFVYRARDRDGRVVAVKCARSAQPAHVHAIRHESQVLGQIEHPGVVRILTRGDHEGIPWFSMELVEGVDLRTFRERLLGVEATFLRDPTTVTELASGRLAPAPVTRTRQRALPAGRDAFPELLGVARLIAETLACVHAHGVVHNDLKPQNILITGGDRPVLVDFGLTLPGLTASRELLDLAPLAGTLPYIAPERLKRELSDSRADIYALACVLYELFAGRPPFVGSHEDVVYHHLHVPPDSLRRHAPEVPASLDALVVRALAKAPADRIAHVAEIADVLAELAPDASKRGYARSLAPPLLRSRFVGRTRVLERLRAGCDAGHLVLVRGESGGGKTRLLKEYAAAAASEGALVLLGSCTAFAAGEGESARSGALRDVLRAIADHCRDLGAGDTRRIVGRRGAALGLYEPAITELAGLPAQPDVSGLSGVDGRRHICDAVIETIAAIDRPVVLMLDDLQWAGEVTLALVGALAELASRGQLPCRVVGACRLEEADELARLLSSPGVEVHDLDHLERDDVSAVIAEMLGVRSLPSVVDRFASRSGGNPFFASECVRAAVDAGILEYAARARWHLAGDQEDELPLPQSLHGLVRSRLALLGRSARGFVDVAAILGREMSVDVLRDVAGADETTTYGAVAELCARGVLEDVAPLRYGFTHDKMREVALATVAPARARELHGRAAESLSRAGDAADPEVLAEHWLGAGAPERARGMLGAAARSAERAFASERAEKLYRRAIALYTEPCAERVELLNELGGRLLGYQPRRAEALALHDRALDDALALGDPVAEAKSLEAMALHRWRAGELDDALTLCDRALAALGRTGESVVRAEVERRRAGICWEKGLLDQAESLCRGALAVFREHDLGPDLITTLIYLASILWTAGRRSEAAETWEEALVLQQALGDDRNIGFTLSNLATADAERGALEEARARFAEADRRHDAAVNSYGTIANLVEWARFERRCGSLDEAEGLVCRGDELARARNALMAVAELICERGHLRLASGRSAHTEAAEARAAMRACGAEPLSQLGRAVACLERAQRAFIAGTRLVAGECREDVPDPFRRHRAWAATRGEDEHG